MRILVTNDDGIDSVGLQVLARALVPLGEVVVFAPDREHSGASAAIGPLHRELPEMEKVQIDGVGEAWAVTAPPALCVLAAQIGAVGDRFDLVVSGINAGTNPGPSTMHSGTLGAAFTAVTTGANAIAVSQAVSDGGSMGEDWDEMVRHQQWQAAATVAAQAAISLIALNPADSVLLNVNVPNLTLEEIAGCRRAVPRSGAYLSRSRVQLESTDVPSRFRMRFVPLPPQAVTDSSPLDDESVVDDGFVATSWLSSNGTEYDLDHVLEADIERALSI